MQNYVFFIFKEAVFLLFPCRSAKVLSAIKEIPSDKENEKDHANMTHACPRLQALEIWLGIRAVESPVPLLGWWFMEATSLSLSLPSHPLPLPPYPPLETYTTQAYPSFPNCREKSAPSGLQTCMKCRTWTLLGKGFV